MRRYASFRDDDRVQDIEQPVMIGNPISIGKDDAFMV
jgi:hypothetical protein